MAYERSLNRAFARRCPGFSPSLNTGGRWRARIPGRPTSDPKAPIRRRQVQKAWMSCTRRLRALADDSAPLPCQAAGKQHPRPGRQVPGRGLQEAWRSFPPRDFRAASSWESCSGRRLGLGQSVGHHAAYLSRRRRQKPLTTRRPMSEAAVESAPDKQTALTVMPSRAGLQP